MALEAKVKLTLEDKITGKLNQIFKRIHGIDAEAFKMAKHSAKLPQSIEKAIKSAKELRNEFKKNKAVISGLSRELKSLFSAYAGVMTIRAVVETSDTITSTENMLNYANGGDKAATEQSMDKIFAAAQRARTGYADMLSNVGKSMALAGDKAFGGNIDNAIAFQEIMAKSYAIGGASAAEQASSMYQMVQALGSGILQGDELRSVREGAPLAYDAIEKFAQGVFNTDESLKDLAADGKITSDIVVAAMLNAGDTIDEAFENTEMTIAQAFDSIKNTATNSMRKVQNTINDFLNSETGTKVINGISIAVNVLIGALNFLLQVGTKVITWMVDNWSWFQFIVYAVAAVILFLAAHVLMGTLAKAIIKISTLLSRPIIIVLAIIAAVALLVVVIANYGEQIGAIIAGVMSVVWNLFVTFITMIIQSVLMPFARAWDMFANFFGNIFNDPIATIIHMFETLANSVLGILHTIASGIDAIFGSNLAGTVEGWMNKVSNKADDLANKYGNGKYKTKSDAVGALNDLASGLVDKYTWDTSLAIEQGAAVGAGAQDWINTTFDNVKNGLGGLGSKLGGAFDANDPKNALKTGGYDPNNIGKGVDNIDKNTGKMADSMEMADEDLEYLRDLAEREWKKEFTTANVIVDMSNYNTINGDNDLDGIVTKLRDKLYEEMDYMANGVYGYGYGHG